MAVPMIAEGWRAVEAKYPGVDRKRLIGEMVRSQIGTMANDLIESTRARVIESQVQSVADVRAAGRCLAHFSAPMREAERGLKAFMYANLYHHPDQMAAADAAHRMVAGLFAAYAADAALLPAEWREALPADEPWRSRHIADFIAGMTDRYAIARYRDAVGPIDLPEGF
jgi:dGTPase